MTAPLADLLARRIAVAGPIGLDVFMAECLGHPEHGYYVTRDPLGAAGDFVTAPEISQMFGELVGLWLVDRWQAQGAPAPFHLVELGPGRGTLMADALRAARLVPAFAAAATLHLVEASPVLRRRQAETLAGHQPRWHDSLDTVPAGPLFVVANEFFDALPIRQFQRTEAGWVERLVTWDDGFRLILGPGPASLVPEAVRAAPVGAIAEVCPAGLTLAAELGRRIRADGGAALVIDYGPAESAPGDSFQAVRGHQPVDPFAAPGQADLTAHVDFAALARAAAGTGVGVSGPVRQGAFLQALGIDQRCAHLGAASPDRAADLAADRDRLTAPDAMGTLFKVLALHPSGDQPPGFPP